MNTVRHCCLAFVAVALAATAGCARMDVYMKSTADFSKIRRVAVLPFTPPPEVDKERVQGISEGVSDIVATQLLRNGWDVVERARVKTIFEERNLALSEMPSGRRLEEVRTLLGVDCFVTGAVTEWRDFVAFRNDGAVGITIKFYDAQTAELIYSGSGSRPIGLFDDKSQSLHAQYLVKDLCAKIPRR